VIAHGGGGNLDHVRMAVAEGACDAVALASMLHYAAIGAIAWRPEDFAGEGNIEFIKRNTPASSMHIEPTSLSRLKAALVEQGLDVRVA
jgi:imidazole glycerol phosphate synthase subunit HisF